MQSAHTAPGCSVLSAKVAWHNGVDCAEFQRLGKDERGNDDLLLRKVAKDKKWQRCPKCKVYVERVAGCVYIVCRYCFAACCPVQVTLMVFLILQIFRCRYCFCYLCGSPMTKGDHRCIRCQRTW
jgi:E3 ubiquitin-protein ligase RNF144